MTRGRKIRDDELVEVTGGVDGLTEVEMDKITDAPGRKTPRRDDSTPGGGPDLEAPDSGSGNQDLGN